jgi:hypothetical protein
MGLKRNYFLGLVILFITGCYIDPNEQYSSAVFGVILDGVEPVPDAGIAIGQNSGEQCLNWLEWNSKTQHPDRQPQELNKYLELYLPIETTTDQNGHFHVPGRVGPAEPTVRREKIQFVRICIVVNEKLVYRGRVSYLDPPTKYPEVKVICDISRKEKICNFSPKQYRSTG